MDSCEKPHKELSGDLWLRDLGFFTDLTAKMNELNTELQGKDRDVTHMLSTICTFKAKLHLWISQLRNGKLTHLPNLERLSNIVREVDPEQFCVHLKKVRATFDRRFQEMHKTEDIVRFWEVFSLPNGIDLEIIQLENELNC